MSMKKGQGLLEATIALGVIITGLIGTISLVAAQLAIGEQTSARIIASNLALEGIEMVRNIRDSNWLANAQWDLGLTGADETAILVFDKAGNDWFLDFTVDDINDADAVMYRQAGAYVQDTITPPGTPTMFSRLLTVDPLGTDYKKRIISTVQWTEKNKVHSITAESRLFNWK